MTMFKNACHFTLGFCDAAMLLAPVYTTGPVVNVLFYGGVALLLAYFIVFSALEDVKKMGKM
jgi:hypothetical protein